MPDYDAQLLESVAVRRRGSAMPRCPGRFEPRRSLDQNLGKAFIGLVVAAAASAGVVGWSFIQEQWTEQGRRPPDRSCRRGEVRTMPSYSPAGR